VARHGGCRAGRWLVQLRYPSGRTSEDYLSQQAWREATLERCPLHPRGGCSLRRHGTYERKRPAGTRVARWYCPQGHTTFSLLPDCLAARLPGTLAELEAVVALVEQAPSLEDAANAARTDDIGLVGALRWVRRRRDLVHANLRALKGLCPGWFIGCEPKMGAVRQHLDAERALEVCRAMASALVHHLPPPLGFLPPIAPGGEHNDTVQHQTGPDPP